MRQDLLDMEYEDGSYHNHIHIHIHIHIRKTSAYSSMVHLKVPLVHLGLELARIAWPPDQRRLRRVFCPAPLLRMDRGDGRAIK